MWNTSEIILISAKYPSALLMILAERRGRGRPARQWKDEVEYEMRVMGLEMGMAMDRET